MSKDKGSKNHKKAPANKTDGKPKSVSDYKSESKSGQDHLHTLDPFITKSDSKADKNPKGKNRS